MSSQLTARIQIANGTESFRTLRESGFYYVDKSLFIREFLEAGTDAVTLLTRPRRFGKTLLLSMVNEFFNIQRKSKNLFDGLLIAQEQDLCSSWMNSYPVLNITLKDVHGETYTSTLNKFKILIEDLCDTHRYLLTSQKVSPLLQRRLNTLYQGAGTAEQVENSLRTLSSALAEEYAKPVIVLIDEYDVPLENSWRHGFFDTMCSFLRSLFSQALKTNESLKFALLTGCLRIAKESIFTGVNNFTCYGINHPRFSEILGFTAEEVDALLKKVNGEEKRSLLKEWYDGYVFGNNTEMYCPWDILQYIKRLQNDPEAVPEAFWMNTSSNSIVSEFLHRSGFNTKRHWEKLLNGGSVSATIQDACTYDSFFLTEDHLWTVLYSTGYLTKAKSREKGRKISKNCQLKTKLVLPNTEIREVVTYLTDLWFSESIYELDRSRFFSALWAGDSDVFTEQITEFLQKSVSYYDSHFDFCHGFLSGVFFKTPYDIISNYERGEGRPDIVVVDGNHSRVAILEVKHTKNQKTFSSLANTALRQIQKKKYDAPYREANFTSILHWGIAFYKKSCLTCCSLEKPSVQAR